MENVEEDDRISNLPKAILYRILYFLSEREAAQTCVLSKSWRFLWAKRLRISYSERSPLFNGTDRTRSFISRVNNALQSHLDHSHLIEVFRIVVTNPKSVPLLEKWIPMLTAIGVKQLFLSILRPGSTKPISYIDLPSLFFNVKYLTRLYLFRCNLGPKSTSPDQKILFDRLQVLRLRNVNCTDQHIFDKIISSCPLLTTMLFQECRGLKTIKLLVDDKELHKYLKHFTFINEHTYKKRKCSIEIHVIPTLETIHIVGSKVRFHGHKFGNLKELSLKSLIFSSNSFDCSVCYEFPCLESLTFHCCDGWEEFDQLIRINAPKILNFKYGSGLNNVPPITFTKPMSRQCKSNIGLRFRDDPKSWFLKLSGLLQVLSQSEICLRVYQNPMHNIDLVNIEQDIIDNLGGGNCKPPAVVEELQLNMGHLSSFPSFLNGMFSICRPRYIAQNSYLREGESEEERDYKELAEFLRKFLRSDSGEFTRQEDLEELSIEFFDKSRQQWQPTMMSECAALAESNGIRFQLKWSEAVCESSSKRRKLE